MNTVHHILSLLLVAAGSLFKYAGDSVAAVAGADKTTAFNLWQRSEELPWLAKVIVGAFAVAVATALVTAIVKLLTYLFRDRHAVLARYQDYFADDLNRRRGRRGRHGYRFVRVRDEVEYRDGDPVVVQRKPLDHVLAFVRGSDRLMVVSAPFGLGKTRLLLEAAKKRGGLRFARTASLTPGDKGSAKGLSDEIRKIARRRFVVVFDDSHQYADELPQLVAVALERGSKVIIATRYADRVAAAKDKASAVAPGVRLGLMANAVDIVRAEPSLTESIARVSEMRPVFVVLAYQHFLRTGALTGIEGKDDLLAAVFRELVAAGGADKASDTRGFLGELALRSALWVDEAPMPGHTELVARLKEMGHLEVGGKRGRQLFRLAPDALRDHIIRDVYAKSGILQDEYAKVLGSLPDSDASNVVRMLGIQYRETGKDVWVAAARKVLERFADWSGGARIGFTAEPGHRHTQEQALEQAHNAYRSFGSLRFVQGALGPAWRGSDKFKDLEHVAMGEELAKVEGDSSQVLACCERALVLTSERAQADPANTDWQRDLSVSHARLAGLFAARGELEQAVKPAVIALLRFGQAEDAGGAKHCLGLLSGCAERLGRDRFVELCMEAGMEQDDAVKLIEMFERKEKESEEDDSE